MKVTYPPQRVSISRLKNLILRPATSSNFQCWFPPPVAVQSWFKEKNTAITFPYNRETQELISLNCMDASLPGSSFATNEINDDYSGVTERHAYRRMYDDRADFTFIVDNSVDGTKGKNHANYRVLLFFEFWMQFIANEQYATEESMEDTNYYYRMNYPSTYQAPYILINKFEKDFEGRALQYRFLQAYPISINSIPVSYESTQVLQCTVSFTYTRYVIKSLALSGLPASNPGTATGPSQPGPIELPVVPFNNPLQGA